MIKGRSGKSAVVWGFTPRVAPTLRLVSDAVPGLGSLRRDATARGGGALAHLLSLDRQVTEAHCAPPFPIYRVHSDGQESENVGVRLGILACSVCCASSGPSGLWACAHAG